MSNRKELMVTLEAALKMTDQVMRDAKPDDQEYLIDRALMWALASWLPSSSLFEGIVAYAVDDRDKHLANCYGRVFVGKVSHQTIQALGGPDAE